MRFIPLRMQMRKETHRESKWLAQSKSEFESLFSSARLLWPLTLTRPSAMTHRPERRGTDQQHGSLTRESSPAVWPLSHDGQEVVEHEGSSLVCLGKHRVTLQVSLGFTSSALYETVKQRWWFQEPPNLKPVA